MMSSLLGFDVLPALNEGDERICLADILILRDRGLSNDELWSVCMECCIGIQDVNSSEMFQTLCITPESMAFDSSGTVCFLDLATDPETMYIPPEYESVGNSYKVAEPVAVPPPPPIQHEDFCVGCFQKRLQTIRNQNKRKAHLYSLGMTLLYAAEYNAGESEHVGMEEELSALVARMTAEDYDERAGLAEVMRLCEGNLKGKCSQRLCMQMASIGKLDSSAETDDSMSFHDSPLNECHVEEPSQSLPSKESKTEDHDACPPPSHLVEEDSGNEKVEFGAITPPVSFRNSIEEYKKALVKSQGSSIVLPSPPKISRMKALVDNGEIKMVEIPSSGSESAGEDYCKTPGTLTLSGMTTPTLSQKSSPVPTMDLGVSQGSAFQVVWSPRSSKHASPVPGQSQEGSGTGIKGGIAGTTTNLQALADARNINYANLLSAVAIEDGLSHPQTFALPASTTSDSSVAQGSDVSQEGMASEMEASNINRNVKTESELRKKLDNLMAKYNQRKIPKMEPPPANLSIWNAEEEDPLQDIPELLPKPDPSGISSMAADQPPITSISTQVIKASEKQHVDPDFEFGPSISPVPASIRRQHVEGSYLSDDDTDSLDDRDAQIRGGFRINVVKLKEDSDEDGEEDREENNGRSSSPHRLKNGQLLSQSGLHESVITEHPNESEYEDHSLVDNSHRNDLEGESDNESCMSTEGEVDHSDSESSSDSDSESEEIEGQSEHSSSSEESDIEDIERTERGSRSEDETDAADLSSLADLDEKQMAAEENMEDMDPKAHAPVGALITGGISVGPDRDDGSVCEGEDQKTSEAHHHSSSHVYADTTGIEHHQQHDRQGNSGDSRHSYHRQEASGTANPTAVHISVHGEHVNCTGDVAIVDITPTCAEGDREKAGIHDYLQGEQNEGYSSGDLAVQDPPGFHDNSLVSVDSSSVSLAGMSIAEECPSDSEGSISEAKDRDRSGLESPNTEVVSDTDSSPSTPLPVCAEDSFQGDKDNKSAPSSSWCDTDSGSDSDTETPRPVTDTSKDDDDDEDDDDAGEAGRVNNSKDICLPEGSRKEKDEDLENSVSVSENAVKNANISEEVSVDNSAGKAIVDEAGKDTNTSEDGVGKLLVTSDAEEKKKENKEDTASTMSNRSNIPRGPIASALKISDYGEPDRQSQTVQEILEKLGYGLHENELWALCRECVTGLARYRYELPAYISPETVFIEDGGEVGYQSVPDDRELEVVYLAPELQEHGVVTERTCLYGIAAMLWSAADYKLPANHEPAITEKLENLFISMTQDNQEYRPTASDVLMVCSEYDRLNEVSSRTVCQSLYSDAQKSEAFGKDNALVRDILVDDITKSQASMQAQVVNCIKVSPELQAQLKPVSERQLAAKPVVRTLHDKLMDEILNPSKKLRKSSKPKVVPVKDIFLNNPDMLTDLRRVTGGRTAFMAPTNHASQYTPGTIQSHQVPNAFQSSATHFSPIVLNANGPSQFSKPTIKDGNVYSSVSDQKIARRMKELNKKLMRNRVPLNIAKDVEEDAHHDHQVAQIPNHINPNMAHLKSHMDPQQQNLGNPIMLNTQTNISNGQMEMTNSNASNMNMGGSSPSGIFPFQVQLQPDPRTGLFQLIPVAVQPQHQIPQPSQLPSQQVTQPQQNYEMINLTAQHGTQNKTTQQKPLSPAEELANQLQKESEDRRRYLKYTQELRARVKNDNQEYQEAQRKSTSRSGDRKRSSKDKEDRHRRSHTIASSDVKDDLARATNNVRNRVKESRHSRSSHESRGSLTKASSEENILEKVVKSNGYSSRSHRSEERSRLKRAKSGSSLDYKNLEVRVKDVQIDDNSHPSQYNSHQHQRNNSRESSSHLSKSQPHLDLDLPQDDVRRHRRSRNAHGGEDSHVRSPLGDGAVSPPPSPSLSKDSGVSGLNMKASGEMTLMERLLNADTLRHQQRLSKVICLLRDEFAFDGYMENGVEDFAMAEYVLSLGNLTWETFNNAITEKYCDLFWQDELLTGLYEAVNGSKPVIEKRVSSQLKTTGKTQGEESTHSYPQSSSKSPQRAAYPRGRAPSPKPAILPSPKKLPSQNQHANWNGNHHIRTTHDTITGSAFRPIRAIHPVDGSSAVAPESGAAVLKPKAMKAVSSHTDTSDSTDNEVSHRPRRFRKKSHLEKAKSNSLHDLYGEKAVVELEDNNNVITKSHSQSNLVDNAQEQGDHVDPHRLSGHPLAQVTPRSQKMGIAVSLDGNKPKVVYIRSSESENDSYESNTNTAHHHDDGGQRTRHMRAMANSTAGFRTSHSFAYRYDSDSSSTGDRKNEGNQFGNPFQRQNAQRTAQRNLSRDDSQSESSRGSGQSIPGRRIMSAKSESYLNILTSGDEFGSRDRLYSGSRRTFRGSVVYYSAEMEHYLRPEIREFAMQVDSRTKENIEAKMATLDQEMMVEHRQKKKTLRFYQKLAEAIRTGKGGDQKGMMAKVSKQLMEMNTKLEFLDSAKKHLEMLYAEQWGLDHYLLYALAQCQPDEPMLLSPSENPMLQYQIVKGAANGNDGHVLQAGLPEGLMAYLFAQNALSEGYIHQFFYCFRYFTTPAELLDFLMVKFHATTLSLSPDADVPAKVKARAIDLLQVWIEGYYSIDFKHNPELTNFLYDFIKEKIVPVEASAEYLLEVLEDAQDDRHIDLHYPQFCVTDDMENQLIQAEAPAKKDVESSDKKQPREWESFKAALHLSAKPQKLRQPVKSRVASMSSDRLFGQLDIDKYDHDAYFPRSALGRRPDIFLLSDYTSQTLAEQLSMMEQDLFRQSHPVHYLNSKAQGVGVALTAPAINKAQSMYRLTAAWEDNQESSLFVGTFTTDDIIQRMLEHSQAISFWVAAEIVVCDSAKEQVASICKFLATAKICQEMRNYATCISILDGLENVLVRQVPAWRNITSKYAAIMEELCSVRVFLKSDNMCLLESGEGRRHPTIPCILLFLLHVQQMEIGGFRLANTMYKWTKMKSISKVIDQARIFKERAYNFEPDIELQDMIRQRMRDLGQQDLHVIAAQHDNNFQKMSSKVPGLFKRMKGKKSKAMDI